MVARPGKVTVRASEHAPAPGEPSVVRLQPLTGSREIAGIKAEVHGEALEQEPLLVATRRGSCSSASPWTSALMPAISREPVSGWRRTTDGSPGAGACSDARTVTLPGRATIQQPVTYPSLVRAPLRHSR